ncbi:MAG TPA: alpha/beta hydrolase-fold protein [Thermoanaerobaculia bacterium]|jgi:predicted alpha/beta superfamily hydrolase|nr:alpha/beta hydrolase-fold protein [Thermoanaerobaculia bacterium]
MSDTLRATFRRVLRLENRRAAIRPGRLERIEQFASKVLGNERWVTVYLPAGYDEREERRYPVLYMQDGQNLFDPERAYVPGNDWRLQDAADHAIGERTAEPMLIVGIDHAGPGRMDEYTPVRDKKHSGGGRAAEYAQFLIEELKPAMDARYRTRADAEHTGVGGSSLGGLVSLWLVLKHPDVFRRAAVMSPSVWWSERAILKEMDSFDGAPPRLWLDIGGREGTEALRDARELRDRIAAKRWKDETFLYFEDRRGDHSERAWARRARQALEFLFPPSVSS